MMEEKQLTHYRFFTWLGAFSVDLSSPLRSAASLRYAQRLLQRNDTAIWIFPQGKICKQNEPVEAKPGTDYLAQSSPHALLVPVAMRYDFFREDRPNALIEIGEPFSPVDSLEGRVAEECNRAYARVTQASLDQDLTGFTPAVPAALDHQQALAVGEARADRAAARVHADELGRHNQISKLGQINQIILKDFALIHLVNLEKFGNLVLSFRPSRRFRRP